MGLTSNYFRVNFFDRFLNDKFYIENKPNAIESVCGTHVQGDGVESWVRSDLRDLR